MLVNRVERGRYLDSVALMRIARRVSELAGVEIAGSDARARVPVLF